MMFVERLMSRLILTLLLATTVVGVVLRFVRLDWSFSFDEAYTATLTRLPWHQLLAVLRFENNPPLYFVIALWWTEAFGAGDLKLRTLSSVASVGGVLLIASAARALWDRRAMLIAVALASGSGMLFFLSREARMQGLLTLLAALSIVTFWRWIEQPSNRRFFLYLAATLGIVATQFTGLVLVGAQTLFIALLWRHHRDLLKRIVAVWVTLGLGLVLWLAFNTIPRLLNPSHLPIWINDVQNRWFGWWLVLGDYTVYHHGIHKFFNQHTVVAFLSLRFAFVAIALASIVTGLWALFRRYNSQIQLRESEKTIYLLLIVGMELIPSFFIRPEPKHFIPGSIAFLLLIAYGIRQWWKKSVYIAAAVAVVVFMLAIIQLPAMVRGQGLPWRPAAQYLTAHERSGDLILVHQWPDELTIRRYYRGVNEVHGVFPIHVPEKDFNIILAKYNAARVITEDNIGPWLNKITAQHNRVWFVYGNEEPFFNGPLVYQWFLSNGWILAEQVAIENGGERFLILFEK